MNTAALYHRPESEFAFLYTSDTLRIRLRTAKGDLKQAYLLHGDTYTINAEDWCQEPLAMKRYLSTNVHDYWICETGAPFKRLAYGFHLIGADNTEVFLSLIHI